MNKTIKQIMNIMDTIEYGFKDEFGKNILNYAPQKWDNDFENFYYLLTGEELLERKCGVCWDQVELERKLFAKTNLRFKTYFIYVSDGDMLPSHTFLSFEEHDKYYWFEHSWGIYKGIHEYDSELDLLLDVKKRFIKEHNYVSDNAYIFVYEYQKPREHISCEEFYKYIETQKLIKLNKPLYFYHLVSKKANMTNGLISLQYMYDNKMYNLFDHNISKYKNRILTEWGISKYKDKKQLTRNQYIDGLNIFRGEHGSNYIYFFKYPPYKSLGNKIKTLSQYKDIYRININDEELQKLIIDIFYGYDMSNSDNKKLTKKYYEKVTKEEYFSRYDDKVEMNFSKLNHIGISFKNGNCPLKFLEKITWDSEE